MKHTLKNMMFLWKICWKTAPGFMIYHIYDGIRLEGFIFLEHVITIQYVLACAEFHRPFINVVIAIGILLSLVGIAIFFDGFYSNSMMFKNKPKLYRALKEQMYEQAANLDLSCYDDPTYYNEFVLAVSQAEQCIDRFLNLVHQISTSITIMVTTGIFFLVTNWQGLIFVGVSCALIFVFAGRLNKLNFEVVKKTKPWERKRDYIKRVSYLNDYAKELRLNPQVGEVLAREFDEANEEIMKEVKQVSRRRTLLGFLKGYVSGAFITDGLYVAYLVFQAAVLGTIPYSSAVVLFNTNMSLQEGLRNFAQIVPMASENSLYVDKIRQFLDYKPKITNEVKKAMPTKAGVITFEHVSFSYKEDSEPVIRDLNMTIHPGEKIALVGYNGTGKTTLIKLFMRLYEPTKGRILYDGVDIREYTLGEYRGAIGVVFQDYQMYAVSLGENVALDDLQECPPEEGTLQEAMVQAGFGKRLESLEKGLDTPITTEFAKDGVNLSGGESQKVAIARGFYKKASILVMDEPSSALDPISEYSLNKAMEEAAKEHTVFYISHRLSTTRDADRIYMLEQGQIVEEGNHNELLNINGKYAKMWQVQAGKYQQ